ncbi:MAG TPA: hypothetical protein PKG82_06365, partial [Myxococcota bacterium]|nr:hypothetical protein [Myxococcota bacterium]
TGDIVIKRTATVPAPLINHNRHPFDEKLQADDGSIQSRLHGRLQTISIRRICLRGTAGDRLAEGLVRLRTYPAIQVIHRAPSHYFLQGSLDGGIQTE